MTTIRRHNATIRKAALECFCSAHYSMTSLRHCRSKILENVKEPNILIRILALFGRFITKSWKVISWQWGILTFRSWLYLWRIQV